MTKELDDVKKMRDAIRGKNDIVESTLLRIMSTMESLHCDFMTAMQFQQTLYLQAVHRLLHTKSATKTLDADNQDSS